MTMLQPGLLPAHQAIVRAILQAHLPEGAKIWIFGSRARGTTKKYADLDLAVDAGHRLPLRDLIELEDAFVQSDLPFKVDIVDWENIDPGFARAIEADRLLLLV